MTRDEVASLRVRGELSLLEKVRWSGVMLAGVAAWQPARTVSRAGARKIPQHD